MAESTATVFAHNMFSVVRGSTVGTGTVGTSFVDREGEELVVKVSTKVWISFMGRSAAHVEFSKSGRGYRNDGTVP